MPLLNMEFGKLMPDGSRYTTGGLYIVKYSETCRKLALSQGKLQLSYCNATAGSYNIGGNPS